MQKILEDKNVYLENKTKYKSHGLEYYTHYEEIANVITHLLGGAFCLVGTIFLLLLADNVKEYIAAAVNGIVTCFPFFISVVYHSIKDVKKKLLARKIDHGCVCLVIMGCGIPLTLTLSNHPYNYVCIALAFAILITNLCLSLISVQKYSKISLILDLVLAGIFTVCYIINHTYIGVPSKICYAVGSVLSLSSLIFFGKKKQFFHAIFHVLTALGTIVYYFAFILILKQ